MDRLVFYRDHNDEWRWRYIAANNRIMAGSGEGYINFGDCTDAAQHVLEGQFTDDVSARPNHETPLFVRPSGHHLWVQVDR